MAEEPNPDAFVAEVIERAGKDNAFAARLRRADNPATEDQSYWFLVAKGIDLTNDKERLPYALICAAICKAKPAANGKNGLGASLAAAFEATSDDGGLSEKETGKAGSPRLARLLNCTTIADACQVLRPLLPFIADRTRKPLDYARLLKDLLRLESSYGDVIRRRWALEFYADAPKNPESGKGE